MWIVLCVLLSLSSDTFADRPAATDAIPKGLGLVELEQRREGNTAPTSRIVGDPTTGRIWEIDLNGSIRSTRKITPWKTKKKRLPLGELMKQPPPGHKIPLQKEKAR